MSGLPPEAAVWREKRWTQSDELSASVIEIVDLWGRRFASLMRAKKIPPPVSIPRPGDDDPKPPSSEGDVRRFLDKHTSNN